MFSNILLSYNVVQEVDDLLGTDFYFIADLAP
jgi:hypothetical protein